jgi:hypothetical protein
MPVESCRNRGKFKTWIGEIEITGVRAVKTLQIHPNYQGEPGTK